MRNYAVLYYCFKNASPIDIFHNPIPSICTLRAYSPNIPIVVMSCNDNEHLFTPYKLTLNFHFHKFTARSEKHQMAFKPIDAYEYLVDSNLDGVIMCDTDIMWHTNIEDIINEWEKQHDKQHIMLQNALNNGLFGLRKGADFNYLQTWFGLCNLFAQMGNNSIVDYILKASYPSNDLHDESTLGVVRRLIGTQPKKIWYYPTHYCYSPGAGKGTKKIDFTTIRSWHYMMLYLKMFFQYKYGHEWMLSHIGRVGFFLSLKEYRQIMEEQLGGNFYKFANHFGIAPQSEGVYQVMTQMQHFYTSVLLNKKES
jgi:hypothetical protein